MKKTILLFFFLLLIYPCFASQTVEIQDAVLIIPAGFKVKDQGEKSVELLSEKNNHVKIQTNFKKADAEYNKFYNHLKNPIALKMMNGEIRRLREKDSHNKFKNTIYVPKNEYHRFYFESEGVTKKGVDMLCYDYIYTPSGLYMSIYSAPTADFKANLPAFKTFYKSIKFRWSELTVPKKITMKSGATVIVPGGVKYEIPSDKEKGVMTAFATQNREAAFFCSEVASSKENVTVMKSLTSPIVLKAYNHTLKNETEKIYDTKLNPAVYTPYKGHPGIYMDNIGKNNNKDIRIVYYIWANSTLYAFHFSANPKTYQKYLHIFKKFYSSLEVEP